METVLIIGAGAAGLAMCYRLRQLGISSKLIDASDQVASSWRARHPQLRLNSHRLRSGQPGMRIPKECGRWVGRDDYVSFLEDYVRIYNMEIQFDTRVSKIERVNDHWLIKSNQIKRILPQSKLFSV